MYWFKRKTIISRQTGLIAILSFSLEWKDLYQNWIGEWIVRSLVNFDQFFQPLCLIGIVLLNMCQIVPSSALPMSRPHTRSLSWPLLFNYIVNSSEDNELFLYFYKTLFKTTCDFWKFKYRSNYSTQNTEFCNQCHKVWTKPLLHWMRLSNYKNNHMVFAENGKLTWSSLHSWKENNKSGTINATPELWIFSAF